ncbi:spore germination protein [Desulforamulus aeronauticus]|uniref:Spore germination protein KA n=1 Tax=Desulforamulus aeronauticus DSM 10349 TaxID=1121421 RepID=A0A1M6NGX8_9FIRM|nr:spore germination protein [Desulforamulus aeronauticus]SHJ94864.1 spore germination protein KA [Desulforamulus aeronauticus DSM 10349]
MNWWKELKQTLTYKPNSDREGFVLKETPKERAMLKKDRQVETDQPEDSNAAKEEAAKPQPKNRSRLKRPERVTGREGSKQKQTKTEEKKKEPSSAKEDRNFGQKHENTTTDLRKPLKIYQAQEDQDPDQVSPYLEVNQKRIEEIYDIPNNKDFIIREFTIAVVPPVKAFAIFMEGMSDKASINTYVLQPLMLFSNFQPTVDGYLIDHIERRVLIGNQVNVHHKFEQIVAGVNFGSTAVFVEGCDQALLVETKGWEHRGIFYPVNEQVIRGPQEAFNETLRTNTGLIRKQIRSAKLTTEMVKVGETTHRDVAIMYLRDVVNPKLLKEVKRRIESLQVDGIVDSGILEQYLEERPWNIAPQVMATERPDRVAFHILRGKIAILLDGSPYALVVPTTMFDQLHTMDDYFLRPLYGTFLRLIRTVAFYISFLTPGIYLSIVLFHKEMVPTELLLAIAGAREKVPFPSLVEVIIMEVSFELIREAGLRVPGAVGNTIGIVGALILGQAAVEANIVSPILIIVVAVTGLSSFAVPYYSLQFSLRIIRFAYIFLGAALGFVGIIFGLFVQMHMLSSLKSFGVPYLAPMSPTTDSTGDVVLRKPVFSWEKRPDYLNTQQEQFQPNIARGWVKESSKRKRKS